MTAEEWVYTINQLVGKTRAGRITWHFDTTGHAAQADVGGFKITFEFAALRVDQQIVAQPDSLKVTLRSVTGARLADLGEAEAKTMAGEADELALRTLFAAIVVEPHRQAIDDFRKALTDL
jgi:hypothetical protein